jgi:hippurate hydrolase
VTEKVGKTGVVAVMRNGAGPTVMLRADMDGLPVVEQTAALCFQADRYTGQRGHDRRYARLRP